jgi:hypothetical protein
MDDAAFRKGGTGYGDNCFVRWGPAGSNPISLVVFSSINDQQPYFGRSF